MKPRRIGVGLLKLTIAATAIAWVARGVAFDDVARIWSGADHSLLLGAVAVFLITPLLQAVRLRRLLRSQNIPTPIGESIRLAFAGNFMNFAAPIGSTSGDVYKAVYLSRRTRHGWEAAAITLIDRAIGLGTLLLSVTLIAQFSDPSGPLGRLRTYTAMLSIGLLGGILLVIRAPQLGGRWTESLLRRLPRRDVVLRVVRVTRSLLLSPRTVLAATMDTLGIQIAAAASFLCVALALGFRIGPADWTALYAYFSAGEIVKALPGPPQGLGTMEVSYGFFFASWAGASQILSAALAIRTVNLICALPGAALLSMRREPEQVSEPARVPGSGPVRQSRPLAATVVPSEVASSAA
ncbi:MAG: UPF0104 family protein [Planctomycetota bacterium]|nr:MAG: UPF0104 family protein [Planctomycetota bacterium]